MSVLGRHSWTPAIAFLAMMGISSMAGDAKASATGNAVRDCCLKRVCTVCCCEPAGASTAPQAAGKSITRLPVERSVSTPALPCECRSGDPASPVSSHHPRTVEERGGQVVGEAVALTPEGPVSASFARLVPPSASPPHSPLYLRNARLLI